MATKTNNESEFIQLLPRFYNGKASGFWGFCRAYLPALFDHFPQGSAMIEPQRDMIAQLLDANTAYLAERKLATMWYRGGGKTTTADAFNIFLIVGKWYNDKREEQAAMQNKPFNRNDASVFLLETRFSVIYSFTEDAAARRTQTIQDCFTNRRKYPQFVNDFGHLLTLKRKERIDNIYEAPDVSADSKIKKSETVLVFNHSVRVEALGMGQAIQGGNIGGVRPDLMRFDDPESPRTRDNKVDLFRRNLDFIANDCYNALDKRRGRIHVIGTNIAPGCTIDVLTTTSGWRKNVFPHVTEPVPLTREIMYSDAQRETDPQRFPLELVRKEYDNACEISDGLRGFLRDMYNIAYDPTSLDATKIIRYEQGDFEHYKSGRDNVLVAKRFWHKPKRVSVTIGVDGGGGKAGSNKTAIVASALTEDGELVVLDAMLVNKSPMTESHTGYFDDIYMMIDKYNANACTVEAYGGGYTALYNTLELYMKELDGKRGTLHRYKLTAFNDATKSKKERAFPILKGFIEVGKFYLPAADLDLFVKQIQGLASGGGGEDDYIDAVVLSQHNNYAPTPYLQPSAITALPRETKSQRQRILDRLFQRNR